MFKIYFIFIHLLLCSQISFAGKFEDDVEQLWHLAHGNENVLLKNLRRMVAEHGPTIAVQNLEPNNLNAPIVRYLAMYGYLETLKYLESLGDDKIRATFSEPTQDQNGITPVFVAATNNRFEILDFFKSLNDPKINATFSIALPPGLGADRHEGRTPAHLAVLGGDIRILELMNSINSPKIRDTFFSVDKFGDSPVSFALELHDAPMLCFFQSLQDSRFNEIIQNTPPAHIEGPHELTAEKIKEFCDSYTHSDEFEKTPAYIAVTENNTEKLKTILSHANKLFSESIIKAISAYQKRVNYHQSIQRENGEKVQAQNVAFDLYKKDPRFYEELAKDWKGKPSTMRHLFNDVITYQFGDIDRHRAYSLIQEYKINR